MALNWQAAVNIVANYKGAPAVAKANADFKNLGKGVGGISSQLKGFGVAVKGVIAALAVREVVQYAKSILDMADNLRDLSQKTGIGIQALSDLKAAAEDGGVEFQALEGSLKKFSVTVQEAGGGSRKALAAFSALGISVKDASGRIKSSDQILLDIADAFNRAEDGSAKAAIAVALFGKTGADLIPVLNGGREAIQGMGVQISDEFADQADEFNDGVSKMKRGLESLTVSILTPLLPAMNDLLDKMNEMSKASWADNLNDALRVAAKSIQYFSNPTQFVGNLIGEKIKDSFKKSAASASSGIQSSFAQGLAPSLFPSSSIPQSLLPSSSIPQSLLPNAEPGKNKLNYASSEEIAEQERLARLREKEIESVRAIRSEREGLAQIYELENDKLNMTSAAYERQKISIEEQAAASKELVRFKNGEQKAAYQAEIDQIIALKQAQIDFAEEQKKSFSVGAKQAFKEYIEAAEDTAAQTKNLFNAAFDGLEDAILDFVKTGKASFADLASTISDMLIRIAIQKSIASAVGGLSSYGSIGFAKGGIMTSEGSAPLKRYARGGIANSPQLAMFGEGAQPEAYVPLPDGRSIPVTLKADGESKGGDGGTSVVVNVNIAGSRESSDSNSDTSRGRELGLVISAAVKGEILNQMRPGGMLARG